MTRGVSPKVSRPAIALALLGLIIVVLGFLFDDDALRTIGLTALGSAVTAFGVGFASDPGEVTTVVEPASDQQLTPTQLAMLEDAPEVEPDIDAPMTTT